MPTVKMNFQTPTIKSIQHKINLCQCDFLKMSFNLCQFMIVVSFKCVYFSFDQLASLIPFDNPNEIP